MLYKLKDLLAVAQNEMISIVVHQIIRSVIGELLPVVEKRIKMNDEDCKCIRTTIIIIVPTCALSHTVYLFLFFVLDCKVLSHTDTLFYWELASVWAFLFAIFFATFEAVHILFYVGALDFSLSFKWNGLRIILMLLEAVNMFTCTIWCGFVVNFYYCKQ